MSHQWPSDPHAAQTPLIAAGVGWPRVTRSQRGVGVAPPQARSRLGCGGAVLGPAGTMAIVVPEPPQALPLHAGA